MPGAIWVLATPFLIFIFYKLIRKTHFGRAWTDIIFVQDPGDRPADPKDRHRPRFTRTLGTLISAGVPILEAINMPKDTSGNFVFERALGKVHDSIREGDTFANPLRESKVCDAIVVNMIDVGEETGDLDVMLMKIADNYDEEVDVAVAKSPLPPRAVHGRDPRRHRRHDRARPIPPARQHDRERVAGEGLSLSAWGPHGSRMGSAWGPHRILPEGPREFFPPFPPRPSRETTSMRRPTMKLRTHRQRARRGFSIVELLVVVAIIVAAPSAFCLSPANTAARRAQAANSQFLLTSVGQAIVRFEADIGYLPPVLRSSPLGAPTVATSRDLLQQPAWAVGASTGIPT